MAKIELEDRVQKIEDVPEKFRALYVADTTGGGGYVFKDVAGIERNYLTLKQDFNTKKEELEQVQAKIAHYESIGDITILKALKEKEAEIARSQVTTNEQLEAWKRDFASRKDDEVKAANEKTSRTTARYEAREIDMAVTTALNKANVTSAGIEYLTPIVAKDIKVFWEDGEPVLKVVGPDGKPRRNDQLDPMEIDELIALHSKKVPHFFRSGGGSGGGSSAAEDRDTPEFDKKPSKWNSERRKAYIARHGHKAYQDLYATEQSAARQKAN